IAAVAVVALLAALDGTVAAAGPRDLLMDARAGALVARIGGASVRIGAVPRRPSGTDAALARVAYRAEEAVVAPCAVVAWAVRAGPGGADVAGAHAAVVGAGRAVGLRRMRAESSGAHVVGAGDAVVGAGAGAGSVDAAGRGVARIVRALLVVVADHGAPGGTAAEWVAGVANRARVAILAGSADGDDMLAAGGGQAAVGRAGVVVVAVGYGLMRADTPRAHLGAVTQVAVVAGGAARDRHVPAAERRVARVGRADVGVGAVLDL